MVAMFGQGFDSPRLHKMRKEMQLHFLSHFITGIPDLLRFTKQLIFTLDEVSSNSPASIIFCNPQG